jgi:tRNA threonylcarbamoyladenosine biosynthesis protein TsaB
MLVLGIDTSLDACSVAIVRNGETLAHVHETMNKGQAERLAPMVREVAQQAGIALTDIDRVVVTTGPGSFTGVRVGLSFARTLALSLGKPCLGVSTLEALALEDGEEGPRAALIETPGASYFARYEKGAPDIAPRPIERGAHEALLGGAKLRGPGVMVNAVALATRAARLDPELYPPNPTYLRAPHVTLPSGS